ncbi:MAG TPA: hypothetical protein VGU45_17255 [Microvirga sp.]|jgi:hypothetical protein|nr:hypothetical protein [Microvirga sp.]
MIHPAGRLLPPFLGCAALLALGSPAAAQSVFHSLFGAPRAPQRSAAYGVPPLLQPFFQPSREPVRRRRPAPKPKPEAPVAGTPAGPVEAKPARVAPDEELVDALMRDSTLQRGDIVVFPDGPRVFNGNGRFTSHRMDDFETLSTSKLVNERTRREVTAAAPRAKAAEPVISFTARPRRKR